MPAYNIPVPTSVPTSPDAAISKFQQFIDDNRTYVVIFIAGFSLFVIILTGRYFYLRKRTIKKGYKGFDSNITFSQAKVRSFREKFRDTPTKKSSTNMGRFNAGGTPNPMFAAESQSKDNGFNML